MLDASLELALDTLRAHPNWYLFPVIRLEKEPAIKNNLNLASNDPRQIALWHKQFRGCNWGVALKKSGLLVMDVDCKEGKDGWATLDMLTLTHGELPETLTVRSPTGGTHFYFEGEHVHKLGKSGFGKDIDSPGYVLIPGCWLCKVAERGYEIVKDIPIAKAPDWFYEYLKADPGSAERRNIDGEEAEPEVQWDKPENITWAIRYLKEGAPPSIQNQNGDNTLFAVICMLRDKGISENLALDLLKELYNVPGRCEPRWLIGTGEPADRMDVKVRNAYRYGQNKVGVGTAEYAFNDPADAIDPKETEAFGKSWNKRLREQNKVKDAKSRDKIKARLTPESLGFDPITGEPLDEKIIDPLTGKLFEPTDDDDDDPPAGGTSAEDQAQDKADAESAEQQGETTGVPKSKQTMKWVRANWVWAVSAERWMRLTDGVMWSTKQFDSYYANLVTRASVSNTLFQLDKITKVERLAYRPGKEVLLDEGRSVNLWRPSKIKPIEGDTALWNEHLNYLFQNINDRDLILNWMAWVYQNQERKPNHGLMIVGRNTGTGKSFVARVLEQLIGPENTQRPKNSSLKGDFNSWALQCKLCIIEELMQVGRQEVANELRDTITESTIEVNIKNINAQKIENYMAMMAITNHRNAMPMIETERRWLVLETFSDRKAKDGEYYRSLFKILETPAALAAIAYELKNRDLGAYDASLSPEETTARDQMIALSRTDVESWLHENQLNSPLTRNLVMVQDIVDAMPASLQRVTRAQANVRVFLQDKLRGVQLRAVRFPDGTRKRLWALHGRADMIASRTNDAIAALYENERKQSRVSDEQATADFMED